MSIGSPPQLMTLSEFLELPERRVERMLIRGELWERKMTYRNPWHSAVLARITFFLQRWFLGQTKIRGMVVVGDTGFRLSKDPDSFVGIDAGFAAERTPLFQQGRRVVFDGPPLLAVEVLSPSDRTDAIEAKIDEYLAANVPLIWIVSPHHRTVTVFRPDAEPELFAQSETLSGEPHLPGLSFPVAELFANVP
jgi:Uma2 family endonuclease